MSTQNLRLLTSNPAQPETTRSTLPLGRFLVESGAITPEHLVKALQLQLHLGAPLGEILIAEGWADSAAIQSALARQYDIQSVDLTLQLPDPELCETLGHGFWLAHRVIPWMRMGETVLIATSRPDQFDQTRAAMGAVFTDVQPVLATEDQITATIAARFAHPLAVSAGTRVAPQFSCRTWQTGTRLTLPLVLLTCLITLVFAPVISVAILSLLAITTLVMFALLKLAAFATHLLSQRHLPAPAAGPASPDNQVRRPKVSVLVPLFHENEIATALVHRLSRLTYPKALLDIILVLEEHDHITRKTLAETQLPSWMRVLEVPAHGGLTTKPRAMNYALDFCRGDIIGVWDAEDAPAADQIEQVVSHFAGAADDVVCLQGILDYYNPRTNWLARCFTIEYSSWFRVVLPGIARLGLVVPLGGTTLFFKRDTLVELGGWDAHNVTEDADLGVRLCRAGYRTELIDTVTYEEANCRPWRWVKQRSRWLKGFMVTYLVHMRSPRQLFADLGAWRFISLQAFFIGTLCQFLLAPVLWSFWLVLIGFSHPLQSMVPLPIVQAVSGLFILTEVLALCIGMVAVSKPDRRFLMVWVPTMIFYFPLGAIAAYKALYELITRPYYWDKTQHGQAVAEIPPG